jgi:hypothetical protein
MDDDLEVPGFLRRDTKLYLAELFIARVALARDSVALCKLLLSCSLASTTSENGSNATRIMNKSALGDIEDAEIQLSEWKRTHSGLLASVPPLAMPEIDRGAFILHQSLLKLVYE